MTVTPVAKHPIALRERNHLPHLAAGVARAALPAQVVQVNQAQQAIFAALQSRVAHIAALRSGQDRHGSCTQVLVGHV